MKNTLFIKTVSGFILISLVLVAAIIIMSYQVISTYHLNSVRDYLTGVNHSISLPVKDYIKSGDYNGLNEFVNAVGRKVDYRITVIKLDGAVIADSEEDSALMDDHAGRREVVDALQKETGESIRYSTTVQSDMLYRAFPLLDDDGNLIAVVRVSIFLDQIETLLSSLKTKIVVICIVILLLSILIIYFYTYRLTRPIKELTSAVKKISEGDFNIKVISHSNDDIGYLINAFSDMTGRIRRLIEELTYRKSSLDTIMSSMKEGLFLIEDSGNIVEANTSFQDIINHQNTIGKKYWEIITNPELVEFISEISKNQKDLSRELIMDNTYYLGSGLITNEGEILILLHNINELKKIEKIKKDIVANVSHELRSPLTAIKGFVETLEGEVTEKGQEYLTIIQRNINRLINIVNDLLTLSRLEKGDSLVLKALDLEEVLKNVARIFEKKINEKGLALEISIEESLPSINADEFKIEQLLTNLIDNAIQYTEKGKITLSVKKDSQFVHISVLDSGCGIKAGELERIFERFYVVDKSRSRKYGGTGLGLAIVKHIALLHNGKIEVSSEKGKGSLFTVSLPYLNR